jgi:hypothetical protein
MQPAPARGLDDVDHTRLTGGRQSPLVQGNLDACYGLAETPCELLLSGNIRRSGPWAGRRRAPQVGAIRIVRAHMPATLRPC